jgi:hypothetical protein
MRRVDHLLVGAASKSRCLLAPAAAELHLLAVLRERDLHRGTFVLPGDTSTVDHG